MSFDYTKYVVNIRETKEYDVYVGRGSKWGNPFSHKHGTMAIEIVDSREEAIECYKKYIYATPSLLEAAKKELKGKILGCFCSPMKCHAEILAEIANCDETINI